MFQARHTGAPDVDQRDPTTLREEHAMADCLWCGRHIPPDMDGEFCSTRCGLLHARAAGDE